MLDFVIRAAAMYFMALLMIRLLGKRALGELGPFDFVVMTGVGHTVVAIALDKSIPFYEGIVILLTLAVLEYLMGYISLKNQTLSHLITGKAVVLIDKGRIIKENLSREKFNLDDLLQELRKQGIRDINEVDRGILEPCGGFSVILNKEDEAVTRRDLGIETVESDYLLTTGDLSRAEVFEIQRELPDESAPDFSLVQSLKEIEKRLNSINDKIETLEIRFDRGSIPVILK